MHRIAAASLASFLLASGSPTEAGDDLIGAKLLVEMVKGTGTIDTGQTSLVISSAGKVATTLGCNRMIGKVAVDGSNLTFGPLMSTKKACAPKLMEQEQIYARTLAEVRSFRIEGPLTYFLAGNGEVLISFARSS